MTKPPALAALILLALAAPAAAQPGLPPGMPPMSSSVEMQARVAEHEAQMDKDMHIVLRLRPDQEGAWRAFRDATRPPAGAPDRMLGPPKPGQSTPQRLDEMDRMAADHQARHAKMQTALRTFYTALSPEQQAVFDALHRLRGSGGPREKMMMHGPNGPGGPPHD